MPAKSTKNIRNTSTATPHPVYLNRIATIDVLRGFALFGILYAHMIFWYSGGALPQHLYRENIGAASGIAMAIYFIFIIGKFFSIFSFLFGLSFYIQMKSLMKLNDNFVLRFAWRLFILGIIGLIHHALWRADILSIYVPLGFLLIFARNLSDKALIAIGFFLILNIPTKIYEFLVLYIQGVPAFVNPNLEAESAHYYDVMSSAPLSAVVIENIKAFPAKFDYQISSGRLIITFGFFLLGMLVGRLQWFEKLEESKPIFKDIWKKSLLVLGVMLALAIITAIANVMLSLELDKNRWSMLVVGFISEIFNSSLTIFYIAGITLLMHREKWRRVLSPLAGIGKMALTSYLTQTAFGLLIFYSFGFGLFAKTTPAVNVLFCIAIFGFQIIFSRWWLSHFIYGPVEWLWRSATFLKLQQIVKNKTENT